MYLDIFWPWLTGLYRGPVYHSFSVGLSAAMKPQRVDPSLISRDLCHGQQPDSFQSAGTHNPSTTVL